MNLKNIINNSLNEARKTLDIFLSNPENLEKIEAAANLMSGAIANRKKIISCGNGGSLCDATHFAEELTARFRLDRRAFPAVAVNDPAFITCASNDFSPDTVFSRYVEALGNEGDVLLAISTSGNSANVIEAAKAAISKGIKVVALTGKNGGELSKICSIEIRAPMSKFSDRVQEIHIKVIHILVECIEASLL